MIEKLLRKFGYVRINDSIQRAIEADEYNDRPIPDDNRVHTYQELISRGMDLFSQGYTEVYPADEPRWMALGYIFQNNNGELSKQLIIRISDFKRTKPDDVEFKTEKDRIEFINRFKSEVAK